MSNYNADSIEKLSFREGCRKRVGMYLGAANKQGIINGFLEIVNNATDEGLVCPTATKIEIVVDKQWISVRDYGRGIPVGKNEFSQEVLIELLTENHTGGKFNTNNYGGKSRGLNGCGSGATCCSSDWFEVLSYRDGFKWFLRFEDGKPLDIQAQKLRPLRPSECGTFIKYQPSAEVFSAEEGSLDFVYDEICDLMKEYSYFNKGISFIITDNISGQVTTHCSKNGLIDFARDIISNPIHKTPLHCSFTEDNIDVEIILQWTKGREAFYLFSNGGENKNGGTPITGAKTAITRTINNLAGTSLSGELARRGLVYIISVNLANPIYDGQTKSAINNKELRSICDRAVSGLIKSFCEEHPDEKKTIIEKLIKEEKAEAAAERARNKILEATKEVAAEAKKKGILAGKLVDCRKHDENSMLILVEGDSALEAVASARDSDYIAVIPLDGKIINALKNPIEKVLDSDRIKTILTALDCGVGDNFNLKKLRYGKIGIMADADPDGFSIMCLILTFFYRYMPQLIKEGRIYWVITPLYRSEVGKGKYYYAYSDDEAETLPKGDLTRFKGLGELQQFDLENTTFKDGVKSIMFTMDNMEEAAQMFEMLMGEKIEARRNYIFENIDFDMIEE